ncbi:MAG: succinate dehydrogenase, hydrophobic membrane anchor protein [Sulfuricaulis sp.]
MSPARPTGSAHAGVTDWLLQRVSSLYMAGFVVYVIVSLSMSPVHDYAAWKSWFATGPVRLAWALFFLSVLAHAWTGLRSIYMDYLHATWLRFSAVALTAIGLLALGLWCAQILLMVPA